MLTTKTIERNGSIITISEWYDSFYKVEKKKYSIIISSDKSSYYTSIKIGNDWTGIPEKYNPQDLPYKMKIIKIEGNVETWEDTEFFASEKEAVDFTIEKVFDPDYKPRPYTETFNEIY